MTAITRFISEYRTADKERIAFAWNGKHAGEFSDANQEFRWAVAKGCIENPALASTELIEHLFLADAEWSRQAWGAPNHFAALGKALLLRGGCCAIDAFSAGLMVSFDTFGACHQIRLPADQLELLIADLKTRLGGCQDEKVKLRLESALELFQKIQADTATTGWQTLRPGAEVKNIRIVSPSWFQRLWGRVTGR